MQTTPLQSTQRLVIGISGASGIPLAEVLLQALANAGVQSHIIISHGAHEVLQTEGQGPSSLEKLHSLAHTVHSVDDISAGPASGSWPHGGMIVCPCSMATLGAIAHGTGSNLLHRAADVCLKERRPLLLCPRETPLSRIHLLNMLSAQEAGAIIMPFCPAFYGSPMSINDLLEHMVGRILDQLAISHNLGHRWKYK